MTLPDPPILVITDRRQCATSLAQRSLETRAERLFAGGCRWLSLREKDLAADQRLSLLRRLMAVAAPFHARVGIHEDVDAACACAAALHLPASADRATIRGQVGPAMFLGQSCHTEQDLRLADCVDYVTLGPLFQSTSKPGYAPALSIEALTAMAGRSPIPVIALGGITLETLPRLTGTGFSGIAVMGEAMRAPDPERWFRNLAAAWDRIHRRS